VHFTLNEDIAFQNQISVQNKKQNKTKQKQTKGRANKQLFNVGLIHQHYNLYRLESTIQFPCGEERSVPLFEEMIKIV